MIAFRENQQKERHLRLWQRNVFFSSSCSPRTLNTTGCLNTIILLRDLTNTMQTTFAVLKLKYSAQYGPMYLGVSFSRTRLHGKFPEPNTGTLPYCRSMEKTYCFDKHKLGCGSCVLTRSDFNSRGGRMIQRAELGASSRVFLLPAYSSRHISASLSGA